MRRIYFLPLVLILLLGLAACGGDDTGDTGDTGTADEASPEGDEPDISGEITMARANWDTGFFQAEIYYQLLGELGYDVVHPSNNEMGAEIFYTSVNEGEVDFWANGWFPLHDSFLEEAPNAEKVGTQVQAGAFQGYLVDQATAEEEGITSIEQIDDNPELAELFDFEGDDGVGDLVGCNSGWGCFETIEEHFGQEDGLGDNLNHVSAEYSALMTNTISRFQNGEPILYYTWTPNWTIAELAPGEDVVWLESPSHPDDQEPVPGDQIPGGAEACAAEPPCDVGWAANDIQVVASSDFLSQNPAAEALFEEIELSVERISEQNALMNEGEDSRDDIERHAQNWIEENRDTVDEWLQTARDAAS